MHEIEAAEREGEGQVRSRPDRNADAAPARDGHGRPERNDLGVEPVQKRTPPGSEVAGAVRRRQDGHGMAEPPQLARDARHVLVHVVGLRPGERRNQADAHRGS